MSKLSIEVRLLSDCAVSRTVGKPGQNGSMLAEIPGQLRISERDRRKPRLMSKLSIVVPVYWNSDTLMLRDSPISRAFLWK